MLCRQSTVEFIASLIAGVDTPDEPLPQLFDGVPTTAAEIGALCDPPGAPGTARAQASPNKPSAPATNSLGPFLESVLEEQQRKHLIADGPSGAGHPSGARHAAFHALRHHRPHAAAANDAARGVSNNRAKPRETPAPGFAARGGEPDGAEEGTRRRPNDAAERRSVFDPHDPDSARLDEISRGTDAVDAVDGTPGSVARARDRAARGPTRDSEYGGSRDAKRMRTHSAPAAPSWSASAMAALDRDAPQSRFVPDRSGYDPTGPAWVGSQAGRVPGGWVNERTAAPRERPDAATRAEGEGEGEGEAPEPSPFEPSPEPAGGATGNTRGRVAANTLGVNNFSGETAPDPELALPPSGRSTPEGETPAPARGAPSSLAPSSAAAPLSVGPSGGASAPSRGGRLVGATPPKYAPGQTANQSNHPVASSSAATESAAGGGGAPSSAAPSATAATHGDSRKDKPKSKNPKRADRRRTIARFTTAILRAGGSNAFIARDGLGYRKAFDRFLVETYGDTFAEGGYWYENARVEPFFRVLFHVATEGRVSLDHEHVNALFCKREKRQAAEWLLDEEELSKFGVTATQLAQIFEGPPATSVTGFPRGTPLAIPTDAELDGHAGANAAGPGPGGRGNALAAQGMNRQQSAERQRAAAAAQTRGGRGVAALSPTRHSHHSHSHSDPHSLAPPPTQLPAAAMDPMNGGGGGITAPRGNNVGGGMHAAGANAHANGGGMPSSHAGGGYPYARGGASGNGGVGNAGTPGSNPYAYPGSNNPAAAPLGLARLSSAGFHGYHHPGPFPHPLAYAGGTAAAGGYGVPPPRHDGGGNKHHHHHHHHGGGGGGANAHRGLGGVAGSGAEMYYGGPGGMGGGAHQSYQQHYHHHGGGGAGEYGYAGVGGGGGWGSAAAAAAKPGAAAAAAGLSGAMMGSGGVADPTRGEWARSGAGAALVGVGGGGPSGPTPSAYLDPVGAGPRRQYSSDLSRLMSEFNANPASSDEFLRSFLQRTASELDTLAVQQGGASGQGVKSEQPGGAGGK